MNIQNPNKCEEDVTEWQIPGQSPVPGDVNSASAPCTGIVILFQGEEIHEDCNWPPLYL